MSALFDKTDPMHGAVTEALAFLGACVLSGGLLGMVVTAGRIAWGTRGARAH